MDQIEQSLCSFHNQLYVDNLTKFNYLHIIGYMNSTQPSPPITSLQLVKLLAEHGYRLFSVEDIKELLTLQQRTIVNLSQKLFYLSKKEWIHEIRRELYALDDVFLDILPIHEFEIATRLVRPSTISHFTAFHVHELTDQLPLIVYATIPTGTSAPRVQHGTLFAYEGIRYKYVQVKIEHFFGTQFIWRGPTKIPITDLERTLLDGLIKPNYCGGMREVIHAYSVRPFDIQKIVDYALRLDVAVAKRLGWILEKAGMGGEPLTTLEKIPRKGTIKLDPTGTVTGKYNKRWQIWENI